MKIDSPPIQVPLSSTTNSHSSESRESALCEIQIQTVEALGFRFTPDCKVLDYGCGDGRLVSSYRQRGVQAYGCDVELSDAPDCRDLEERGWVARMTLEPLAVPFSDQMFDLVTSNMVFEHVRDYEAAFAELRRVLKPGGMTVHVFAARYSPLEQHSFVPLAGIFQSYWWLYLWALLGIRNPYQVGCTGGQTARRNYRFLHGQTHYPTKRQIRKWAARYFERIMFREDVYLRFTPRGRRLGRMADSRLLAWLYGATRARVLVAFREGTTLVP